MSFITSKRLEKQRTEELAYPGKLVTETISGIFGSPLGPPSKRNADGESASASAAVVKLGPGLLQVSNEIVAVTPGQLLHQQPNKFWVASSTQRRYVPAPNDLVIGIVSARLSEMYRIDLGGSQSAALPALAFDGATKKNKPNLQVGSLVFAKVTLANKDVEPELNCADAPKADGLGEVKAGFLVRCSVAYSQYLQRQDCPVLETIGKFFAFEITVGVNGRFVVDAGTLKGTLLIANLIRDAQFIADVDQLTEACKEVSNKLK